MERTVLLIVLIALLKSATVVAGGQSESQSDGDGLACAFSIMILDNPYFVAVRDC